MTASTTENGLRARLHRLARGSVVLAAVLGLCATGSGAAVAATDGDDPAVELLVSAGTRGTVAPGTATTASLTVQNGSDTRLTTGRVTVEIGRTPLGDEAALSDWLDDADASGDFDEIGSDTTSPVDPDTSVTSSLLIPAETLADLTPGVYPLRASLTGATEDAADAEPVVSTSVLVVSDATAGPIAVFVPITATPADGALLTAEELTTLTAADGALTAVLDGVSGTSSVLAIDPAILASIRVLGSAAPEPATDWLRRLDALPNERFALQFGDADVAAQSQAGLTSPLRPTTLAPFLDPSRFATAPTTPTADPTEAPAQTPSPGDGPVLPDDATLTAVDGATAGIVWPRGSVVEADLTTFANYFGASTVSVLPSSSTSGSVGGHSTIDGHDVLVTDAAASGALSRAANENDAAARQALLAEASAHLSLSGRTSAGAPVLVGLSRDETRSAEALKETISAVDTLGFGLSGILAAQSAVTTLTSEADTDRALDLQSMLADEPVLGQFATMLDDPQQLLSPKRIQIMRASSVGLGGAAYDDAVAAVGDATLATLQAVDIPPASTIQLLSANADLPFSVRNDLPWPVNIRLSVEPSDPRLEVDSPQEATVQPGTTTRIKVPVSARVGSGELNLRLQLSSPTGVTIGQVETVRVSVRAEWETIGLVVFGALIVLLLGLGTIRTIVRRRRERADADASDADAVDAAEESS
jgi:hypothetical protein